MSKKKLTILSTVVLILGVLMALVYQPSISVEELKKKYTNEESEFININGLDVHYRDEGRGPVLVLIHGTASSLHTWDAWTEELKDDFRVIRMDIPAFGLTGPNEEHDYTVDAYNTFLDTFLVKLNIKRCYIAGNSLGGLIAWNYALKQPEVVKKLVLIDAAGYPPEVIPFVFKLARIPVLNQLFKIISPRAMFIKSINEVYFDDSKVTEELIDRYFELGHREGNRSAFLARANQPFHTNYERIGEIKQPTLIQWGKQDVWIPVKNGHRFKRDMDHAYEIVYDSVGHVPMEEIPLITAADAKLFLQSYSMKQFKEAYENR